MTRLLLLVAGAALLLGGCSGTAAPIDDGSYSAADAAAPSALASAGVDLLAGESRAGLTVDDVRAALVDAGFPAESGTRADSDGLAVDPGSTAGLVGTAGNQVLATAGDEHYVVLVFGDPAAAVVFAQDAPDVFSDAAAQEAAQAYVAGSLVGYYAPADGVDETQAFSEVLGGLAAPTP